MASKLFLILKSPGEWSGEELMRKLADDSSAAVLLNDAVLFATNERSASVLNDHCREVYAMKDDLQARGLKPVPGVKEIDYRRLAELIMDDYQLTVTL